MKYILLPNKKQVIVDDDDYDELSKYKWHLSNGYAIRHVSTKPDVREYMHRAVNKTPDGFVTDHINGDKLDNRKSNLRTATLSQNGINYGRKSGTTNPHRGVSLHKKTGKWRARIMVNKKEKCIGYFDTPYLAKQAREAYEKVVFGEFASV